MRWFRWGGLAVSAVALVMVMDVFGLVRQPDRILQDALVASHGRNVQRSDVVIVAIDEKTISALGTWAFREASHAELIDRISKDSPRAIGLDVLLTDSDTRSADDDKALAASLQQSGRVVLPMTVQTYHDGNPQTLQPVRALAASANRLGLDRLPVDHDGVLRSIYLQEGLAASSWITSVWPCFALVSPIGSPCACPATPRRKSFLTCLLRASGLTGGARTN